MNGVACDLIAGYLEELYAGLRVPAAEAELIAAETEDHLRETAAAGIATGMTELEAQQAAISSFGPVRAVARAHRRRTVTAGGAAMAAWKLAALLATTVGVGGLAGMGIFTYLTRSAPSGPGAGPTATAVLGAALSPGPVVYAAMAAGGLVLLATRRLTRHGTRRRDPLPPGVTASCFLVASALLWIFGFVLRPAPAPPQGPTGPCSFVCHFGSGPVPGVGAGPGAGPVLMVLVIYAAMAAAGLVLLVARRLTRRRTTGRDRLSPEATASCFLLTSAPLVALIVRLFVTGRGMPIAPALTVSWATPLSAGSVSEAPLVSGALVAGCLTVAVGYGLVAALRRARRWPGSGALGRVLGQADRDGAGRAYV
jgi:MYXO-CTERM domain-containing protein